MRNFTLRLLAAVCCVWAMTAYAAKITLNPPSEVPVSMNAQEFKELTVKRNDLLAQFGETQGMIDSQARDCQEVEEDSPKVADCMAKAKDVKMAVKDYRAALERFEKAIASKSATSYTIMSASVRGEVYAVTSDGHKIPIDEHRVLTIDSLTTIITGPAGRVQFLLPDETSFTIGSGSEMMMDSFVFDPKTSVKKFSVKFAKGSLRWVTGKAKPHDVDMQVQTPVGTIGIRGTEFELFVSDNGSGNVKLFSGELLITPKNGSPEFILKGGQMVRFTHDKFETPEPIPASV